MNSEVESRWYFCHLNNEARVWVPFPFRNKCIYSSNKYKTFIVIRFTELLYMVRDIGVHDDLILTQFEVINEVLQFYNNCGEF